MEKNMDTKKTEELLLQLDDEIEKKCLEIKQERETARLKKVFFTSCLLVVLLPILDIFLRFSILAVLIPVGIFQAVSLLLLMPVILNSNERGNRIERIGQIH